MKKNVFEAQKLILDFCTKSVKQNNSFNVPVEFNYTIK